MSEEQALDECRRRILDEIILAGLNAEVEVARSLRDLEKYGVQLKLNFDEEIS